MPLYLKHQFFLHCIIRHTEEGLDSGKVCFKVLHMDHEDAGVLENQLVQRGNVDEQPEDSVRTSHDAAAVNEGETSNTNVVVETPPAVASTSGSDSRYA